MKTPEEFRKEKEEFPRSHIICEKLGHYTTDDLMQAYADYVYEERVKEECKKAYESGWKEGADYMYGSGRDRN